MSILKVEVAPFAYDVKFKDAELVVSLIDGRTISTPISWFPILSHASKEQLENWELLGEGEGIHWPDLDEDLSVNGLLKGVH